VVVVTLAEEMPVQEALELREGLREKKGADPDLLIVNGLYPPLPEGMVPPPGIEVGAALRGRPVEGGHGGPPLHQSSTLSSDPVVAAMLELWRRRREVNERELAHLEEAWQGPRVELPLLPVDRGPLLLRSLSPIFHEAVEAAEAEA
jgi:hypothetical protein